MSAAAAMAPRIERFAVTDHAITAHLTDGRVISVPLAWSWRLSEATPAERANWQLVGDGLGVHWPDVDEDICAEGMLRGGPACRPRTGGPARGEARRPTTSRTSRRRAAARG
jgi:hypothetical protein